MIIQVGIQGIMSTEERFYLQLMVIACIDPLLGILGACLPSPSSLIEKEGAVVCRSRSRVDFLVCSCRMRRKAYTAKPRGFGRGDDAQLKESSR